MNGKKLLVILIILGLCSLTTVLIAAIVLLLNTVNTQNSEINQLNNQLANPQATQEEGTWEVSSKIESQETSEYRINIEYPQFTNESQLKIQTDVNKYIKDLISSYKNAVMGVGPVRSAMTKPTLSLNYEIKFLSNKLVSFVISGSEYLGGAHPMSVYATGNYDLTNNKELKISDIFNEDSEYLELLSIKSKEKLNDMMGGDLDDSMLEAGTSPHPGNFLIFYFSGDDRVSTMGIIFPEYQVAPYAAGVFTVELSESVVSGMFDSEFSALL